MGNALNLNWSKKRKNCHIDAKLPAQVARSVVSGRADILICVHSHQSKRCGWWNRWFIAAQCYTWFCFCRFFFLRRATNKTTPIHAMIMVKRYETLVTTSRFSMAGRFDTEKWVPLNTTAIIAVDLSSIASILDDVCCRCRAILHFNNIHSWRSMVRTGMDLDIASISICIQH